MAPITSSGSLLRRTTALAFLAPLLVGGLLAGAPAPASAAPKTACPHKDGYQVFSDSTWAAPYGTETVYPSMADAEAACASDGDCVAFNNYGAIIKGFVDNIDPSQDALGTCVYVKGFCAPVAGYTAFNNTASMNPINALFEGLSEVASACSSDSTCPGFYYGDLGGTAGGIISDGAAVFGDSLLWAQGFCYYMKNDQLSNGCIPKYGYSTRTYTSLNPMTSSDSLRLAGFKLMSGGAASAEAFCKINPRCRGWDTRGQVAIGGFTTSSTGTANVCTYIKDPCPPRAGFIAYADATDASTPPARSDTSLCAADVYNTCLADPSCKAFNTLRSFWTTKPDPTDSFPGMCTYVRAEGY